MGGAPRGGIADEILVLPGIVQPIDGIGPSYLERGVIVNTP